MKRIVLLLSILVLVPVAIAQTVTQHFTGTVQQNIFSGGGPGFFGAPAGSQISGTFVVNLGNLGVPITGTLDNAPSNSWEQSLNSIGFGTSLLLPNTDTISAISSGGSVTVSNLESVGLNVGPSTFVEDALSYGPPGIAGGLNSVTGEVTVFCQSADPLKGTLADFPLTIPVGCSAQVEFFYNLNQYVVTMDLTNLSGTVTSQNKGTGSPCDESGAPWCGNPISIGNGNKYQQVEDYRTQGSNPLTFERFYNSLGNTGSLATTLGTKWRSNYDRFLRIVSSNSVTAERADGQEVSFSLNGGQWTSDSDVDLSLTKNGSLWILTDKNDTVEFYTAINSTEAVLQSIKARNGYTQTLTHNSSDQTLASVTDSYGRSLFFAYQNGHLNTVTTPDNLLTFGYTPQGQQSLLTKVSYSTATSPATSVSYIYDNPSLPTFLTKLMDEDGNLFAQWTYDSQGRALTSQHGGGAELTTVTYNDSDNSRTVTNALGVTDTYSFSIMQGVPKVTKISRAATATTATATQAFTYDNNGYLSGKIDWNGNTTTYTNDAHGQPQTIVEAFSTSVARTTTMTYDPVWVHLPSTITTSGLTTAFNYDSAGNLHTRTLTDTTSINGTVRTWTFGWSNYLLTSITGPRTDLSAITTLGYDTSGALTSITNPLGQPTTIKLHTPGGRPQTIVDPNGVMTQLVYDGRQRMISSTTTTAAGQLTTSYGFDPAGNLISTTQPDGSKLTNLYDTAHRLTQVTDSLGNYIKFTLDALDDQIQANIYKKDGTLTWQRSGTFDALGRLLISTAGAGQTTTQTFDLNGNVLSAADGLGHKTTNVYDALNRITTSTDPNGGVTAAQFDAHDRILTVTDANGNATSYARDGFGEVIQRISPDSGTAVFHYDADGDVTSKTDAMNIVTSQTFDALDRPLTRTYPASPAENVSFTYGQAGTTSSFGIGRLAIVTDQAGTLTRQYDERGNVTNETRVGSGMTLSTSSTFDAAGRVSSLTYPDGTLVTYQHDVAGYLSNASARLPGASFTTQIATFTHQPFGPVGTVTYGNGTSETWTFDQSYRPSNIADVLSSANLQNLTYGYDLASNVVSIKDAVNAANSQTFGYDPLNRLNSAVSGPGGYGSLGWQYDKVGNRLTQTQNGAITTYTYAPDTNRLATISPAPSIAAHSTVPAPGGYDGVPVQALFGSILSSTGRTIMSNLEPEDFAFLPNGFGSWASELTPASQPVGGIAFSIPYRDIGSSKASFTPAVYIVPSNSGGEKSPSVAKVNFHKPSGVAAQIGYLSPLLPPKFSGQLVTPIPVDGSSPLFQVTIQEPQGGGGPTIFYTVDGSTPTRNSLQYTGPVNIPANTLIKAFATGTGYSDSGVGSTTFIYTVTPTPTISPAGGVFRGSQQITVSDSKSPTSFYYTTDGTTPTTNSARFAGHITLTSTATLKVIGVALGTGYYPSAVASASYINSSQNIATVTTNANGNITSIPPADGFANATFSYNDANRLKSVTGSPTAATFLYYYAGQRISKIDGGTPPTIYSYAKDGSLLYENDNGIVTDYVYADGRPIAVLQPTATPTANQVNYVMADRLGTPQSLINSSGIPVWSTTYQPFGTTGTITASVNQNLRFPGQLADAETGFSYNLNRDYMPNLGRYLETDPLGIGSGLNTYLYAEGNPIRWTDHLGLSTIVIITQDPIGPFMVGTHAAVYVDNGHSPVLYDPAGSYEDQTRGSGDILYDADANLAAYIQYHQRAGDTVSIYVAPTTPDQESVIAERAEQQNGGFPGQCSILVSSAIRDVGPFTGVGSALPGILGQQVSNLPGVKTTVFRPLLPRQRTF